MKLRSVVARRTVPEVEIGFSVNSNQDELKMGKWVDLRVGVTSPKQDPLWSRLNSGLSELATHSELGYLKPPKDRVDKLGSIMLHNRPLEK